MKVVTVQMSEIAAHGFNLSASYWADVKLGGVPKDGPTKDVDPGDCTEEATS